MRLMTLPSVGPITATAWRRCQGFGGCSKVELHAHLGEARQENPLRSLPCQGAAERIVQPGHRVPIEHVEQIEVHGRARLTPLEDFPNPDVELIEPLPVERAWGN